MIQIIVPVASLLVAALAVFVGPLVASRSAKRSMIGTMREKWISEIRSILAELTGRCMVLYSHGLESLSKEEFLKITELQNEIEMMLTPEKSDHQNLIDCIRDLKKAIAAGEDGAANFLPLYNNAINSGRKIVYAEWDKIRK